MCACCQRNCDCQYTSLHVNPRDAHPPCAAKSKRGNTERKSNRDTGAPLPRSISTKTDRPVSGLATSDASPSHPRRGQWLLTRHGIRCFERRLLTVAGAAQELVLRPHLFPVSPTSLAGCVGT
jgi:hypothetical protein